MSVFNITKYRIRIQLVDENGKIIESYVSPEVDWLRGIEYFDRINKTKWKNEMVK